MDRLTETSKPPFYATMHLVPVQNCNIGQHSDALATLTSSAMLKTGFLGFSGDINEEMKSIRFVYFDTYSSLVTWLLEAQDLLPYSVQLNDIICDIGCLWKWLSTNKKIENIGNVTLMSA